MEIPPEAAWCRVAIATRCEVHLSRVQGLSLLSFAIPLTTQLIQGDKTTLKRRWRENWAKCKAEVGKADHISRHQNLGSDGVVIISLTG